MTSQKIAKLANLMLVLIYANVLWEILFLIASICKEILKDTFGYVCLPALSTYISKNMLIDELPRKQGEYFNVDTFVTFIHCS